MELARQLAAFPQATMPGRRASAMRNGICRCTALHQEWERGKACTGDALEGAARFAAGDGRHGQF
ncbi:MAG: hypothetical protein R3E92_19905 [Burkholderiaceae bacterium]